MTKHIVIDAIQRMQIYLRTQLKATDTVDFICEDFNTEESFGRRVFIKVNDEIAFSKKAVGPSGVHVKNTDEMDEILTEALLTEMIFFSVDVAMKARDEANKPKIITNLN